MGPLNQCSGSYGINPKSAAHFVSPKVNEEEAPAACAIREVYEETGFDIAALIDETSFIERSISDQFTRLYIVKGKTVKGNKTKKNKTNKQTNQELKENKATKN